jgi:hypothetical protein
MKVGQLFSNFGIDTAQVTFQVAKRNFKQLAESDAQVAVVDNFASYDDEVAPEAAALFGVSGGNQNNQGGGKNLGAGAITEASVYQQQAMQITQAQQVLNLETSQTQAMVNDAAGELDGYSGTVRYLNANLRARQNAMGFFMEQTLQGLETQMDQVAKDTIALQRSTQDMVGEQIRTQQEIKKRLQNMRNRLQNMTQGF